MIALDPVGAEPVLRISPGIGIVREPHPLRGPKSAVLPRKNRPKRRYGHGHLHFITFSCYRRRPTASGLR